MVVGSSCMLETNLVKLTIFSLNNWFLMNSLSSGAVGKLKTSLVSRVIGKLTEFQTWRGTRGVPRCDVSSRGRRPPGGVKVTSDKDKVANRGFVENENSWLVKEGQSKR